MQCNNNVSHAMPLHNLFNILTSCTSLYSHLMHLYPHLVHLYLHLMHFTLPSPHASLPSPHALHFTLTSCTSYLPSPHAPHIYPHLMHHCFTLTSCTSSLLSPHAPLLYQHITNKLWLLLCTIYLYYTNTHYILIAKFLSMQISFLSVSPALSDRTTYKRFFRVHPSVTIDYPAYYTIMEHFGWKRVGFLTQNEDLFTLVSIL